MNKMKSISNCTKDINKEFDPSDIRSIYIAKCYKKHFIEFFLSLKSFLSECNEDQIKSLNHRYLLAKFLHNAKIFLMTEYPKKYCDIHSCDTYEIIEHISKLTGYVYKGFIEEFTLDSFRFIKNFIEIARVEGKEAMQESIDKMDTLVSIVEIAIDLKIEKKCLVEIMEEIQKFLPFDDYELYKKFYLAIHEDKH